MAVEGFEEIFNTVYIAKKLYDLDKYDLAKESLYDVIEFDTYYESMYYLIENLFEYQHVRYSDRRCVELRIMSDPVITDFYLLAGEYGRNHSIANENNPYIIKAQKMIDENLNFSYCVECKLVGYTEPKRKYHSRLGVFIYQDDWVDLGCLAYALIEVYEWFWKQCADLRKILAAEHTGKEVIAA